MARRSPAKRPPTPLATPEDGEAADWPLIARTLFVAAFDAADRLQKDNARQALLRRVHEGSYNRLTDDAGEKTDRATASPSLPAEPRPGPDIHARGVK